MARGTSIQKVPAGLLAMLNMKGTGQNPVDLAMQVLPTIDLSEAYSAPLIGFQQIETITAIGQDAALTVPDGFVWRLLGMGTVMTNTGTGGAMIATTELRVPRETGGGLSVGIWGEYGTTLITNEPREFGTLLDRPLWLPPGSVLQTFCRRFPAGGGTTTLDFRALVQPLQI